jgi:ribosome-associated protein
VKPVLPSSKKALKQQLALACNALLDKKAEDLTLLYFGEKSSLTDCFIIASGTSDPHLKALRDNLEKTLKENNIETLSRERFKPGGWLVLDAIDFVVHLFSREQRENYALEHLWKDSDQLSLEELGVSD